MATHSSTLAWKIPWTEQPGRLQSMESLGVGHNRATSLSRTGEGNGNPLQCSCLENPRDRGAWWATVYGVVQSPTRLKRLSSSSSRDFPGGTVDRNPPANAGDTGLTLDPGRFHMLSPQLLKPECLEPVLHKRSRHNEKPIHCKEESSPLSATSESLCVATEKLKIN